MKPLLYGRSKKEGLADAITSGIVDNSNLDDYYLFIPDRPNIEVDKITGAFYPKINGLDEVENMTLDISNYVEFQHRTLSEDDYDELVGR